jgi:tetratricopeptide (TPR) repeat protein
MTPELRPLFVTGNVAAQDGAPLPEAAAIQINCPGWNHTFGYTDSKGSFALHLDRNSPSNVGRTTDVTDTDSALSSGNVSAKVFGWRDCQLKAVLPGFRSQVVELAPHIMSDSRAEVGNIVVRRTGEVQGLTISATTAAAPSQAKKDFEKGLSLEKKSDWVGAQEKFQSAVALYPKYAVAWVELGRMQGMLNRDDEAKQSLQKALDADTRFLPAFQELAEIAAKQMQWQELAEVSEKALQLAPPNPSRLWLFNAVANLQVNNLDAAQASAAHGLQVDTEGRYPKLEYVLGLVLAQKRQYHEAIPHIRNFLKAAPNSPDAANAQRQLKKLESLEAAATGAPLTQSQDAK